MHKPHSLFSIPLVLFVVDLVTVNLACMLALGLKAAMGGSLAWGLYAEAWPRLLIFPLLYLLLGLYPGTFLRRAETLQRYCIGTSCGFLFIALSFFLTKQGADFSRMVLLSSWMLTVVLAPLFRSMAQLYCTRFSWWNYPLVIIGSGPVLHSLLDTLPKLRLQNIEPVCILIADDNEAHESPNLPPELPCIQINAADSDMLRQTLCELATRYPGAYALISFSGGHKRTLKQVFAAIETTFRKIIVLPDMSFSNRVWLQAADVAGLPGMLMRQNLLDSRRLLFKRCLDLGLTFTAGIVLFPLLCLLALIVRLDSKGPALFKHERIGYKGKRFGVLKFRTMNQDAAAMLEAHLADNPEARTEWAETQKLKDDPRITRVGAFLRKTSLDELPQLLNVVMGTMSLVGPRPIVEDEIIKYGDTFDLYTRVHPGITGLWQVSGRNNVSYETRVALDRQYICNWSVWMDIDIVVRTIPEVIKRSGAY